MTNAINEIFLDIQTQLTLELLYGHFLAGCESTAASLLF